jgi:putative ABC transport system permease protein
MYKTKRSTVLVNEEMVKMLGYKSNEAIINQHILFEFPLGDVNREVVGVIKN